MPGQQHIQDALFGSIFGAYALLLDFRLTRLLDRHFGQVADDGIHILADIAHFGELGGFDLDEWRIGQTRQAPCDLSLAHASGANHENVLGCDLGAQRLIDLLAAPAIAQRNGHRTLGPLLADDVAIEFTDNFLGGHGRHDLSIKMAINAYLASANSYYF